MRLNFAILVQCIVSFNSLLKSNKNVTIETNRNHKVILKFANGYVIMRNYLFVITIHSFMDETRSSG